MSASHAVLVTGGAGFIASHIVDALIDAGHRVTVVDNLSTGNRSNVNEKATFHECDIADRQALEKVFASGRFDIVCHHAAQINVRRSVADPGFDASVNILGFLNLLACCQKSDVRRVVLASTGGAVYGEQRTFPAAEDHEVLPLSPYGVAKLASEKYLFYYHAVHGMDGIVLRYSNVYGPRQNALGEAGVVAVFASCMLEGKEPVINGDGGQTRDFVYVGDVVRANLLAMEQSGYHIYNVGTGEETDVNTVFAAVSEEAGWKGKVRHGPAQMGEQRRSVLDCGRIRKELGWSPRVGFREGIRTTIRSFRNGQA